MDEHIKKNLQIFFSKLVSEKHSKIKGTWNPLNYIFFLSVLEYLVVTLLNGFMEENDLVKKKCNYCGII